MHASDAITADNFAAFLRQEESKDQLRFITCGSVDDGKSTLIGRLLVNSNALYDDQLASMQADSRKWGTQGDEPDLALLMDGLAAEREQGITIDVSYRFFSSARRKFIIADTPGHEQYTRNMVTGASTADAAVVLVDARKGLLLQTCRHSFLVNLLGIRHVVLAVNKMDMVDYSEAVFTKIADDYAAFARRLGLNDVRCVPISALRGDNVRFRSTQMPWYQGPSVMEHLEDIEVDAARLQRSPLRMSVQWVSRPNQDFRGYAGTVASGTLQAGDRIRVQPSGAESTIKQIITPRGEVESAVAGESVMLTLAHELSVARGDLIAAAADPAQVADQFECSIVWMQPEPLLPGRTFLLKIGCRAIEASVMDIKYQVKIDSLEHIAANTLALNAVGVCTLQTHRPIPFDAYADNRETGGFLLIDKFSNATAGAGLLHFALRRSQNIQLQHVEVHKAARNRMNGQQGCVIWLTGLSGSGKSTIANLVEKKLHLRGHRTYLLDGDNVRHGLNRDLGFTDEDRVENIRRVAEVARLMVDAGLIVVASFISPFRADREMARALMEEGEFLEVHVDVPLAEAERRDPKGLYSKARRGLLKHFTGIDSPYEPPESPELRLSTGDTSAEEAADAVVRMLEERGRLSGAD